MKEDCIVFEMPGNKDLADGIRIRLGAGEGQAVIRKFPDGESYIRIEQAVKDKDCIVACTLYAPDPQFIPLYFLIRQLRSMEARSIILAVPYLSYMRQDIAFQEGECVTARVFPDLFKGLLDGIVTVDPHLHRIHSLSQVYVFPALNVSAAPAIGRWVKAHIPNPVLVGPDIESSQWVSKVADVVHGPHLVLEKVRSGDRSVKVSVPDTAPYEGLTPVLVDDIISTAHTMAETVKHLVQAGMPAPVCIGVHGIFAGDAVQILKDSGAAQIVTSNTIPGEFSSIDVVPEIVEGLQQLL